MAVPKCLEVEQLARMYSFYPILIQRQLSVKIRCIIKFTFCPQLAGTAVSGHRANARKKAFSLLGRSKKDRQDLNFSVSCRTIFNHIYPKNQGQLLLLENTLSLTIVTSIVCSACHIDEIYWISLYVVQLFLY